MNHLGKVSLALLSFTLLYTHVNASEPIEFVSQTKGNKGGSIAAKEAQNSALKMARSKPSLTTATGIVCLACVPVAGASASAGMCVACGILIAKTFG